jgi:hypothetical protein
VARWRRKTMPGRKIGLGVSIAGQAAIQEAEKLDAIRCACDATMM